MDSSTNDANEHLELQQGAQRAMSEYASGGLNAISNSRIKSDVSYYITKNGLTNEKNSPAVQSYLQKIVSAQSQNAAHDQQEAQKYAQEYTTYQNKANAKNYSLTVRIEAQTNNESGHVCISGSGVIATL